MKWSSFERMRLFIVFVLVFVPGGGIAKAGITISLPVNLGPVINDENDMQEGDFSHDGLEFYFSAGRPGGYGIGDIWVSRRETLNSPWQEPVNLGPNVNSSASELEPSISGDGLELYLGCWSDYILRVCTRPSKDAPWSSPVKIGPPVCSVEPAMEVGSNDAWAPDISADGLSLYFSSTRAGGYGGTDIWVSTRATKDDPWGEPINLGSNVNTSSTEWSPCISTDGLTLVFTHADTSIRIWASTRKSVDDDWGPAVQLPIRSGARHGATLSPDNSTLYLEAYKVWGGYGAGDYWQVNFIPVVDFNGDGNIDTDDLLILIEHWKQEESLCDIAPLPLGDGIVDMTDLEAFMTYWEQENMPELTEDVE
jgi:hypothetical protein